MTDFWERPLRLVLASRSSRRASLLRQAGYEFVVEPADIDENDQPPEILPADLAVRLARAKARVVAAQRPEDVILAADTVVAFGDMILGKPQDAAHARHMLRLLAATTHIVITGVVVMQLTTNFIQEKRVMSVVQMRALTRGEVDRYIASGQWSGKAGGYGIQDSDPFVVRKAGCYTNIVGLPMKTAVKMLAAAGIHPTAPK